MTKEPSQPREAINVKSVKRKRTGLSITGKPSGAESTKPRVRLSKKASKYRNKGVRIDDHYFHSTAESVRYVQLKQLVADGVIEDLELQPQFPIIVNNIRCTKYIADFRYRVIDERGATIRVVVEDVKGFVTDIYKLKKQFVHAAYDFEIQEIPGRKILEWAGRPA